VLERLSMFVGGDGGIGRGSQSTHGGRSDSGAGQSRDARQRDSRFSQGGEEGEIMHTPHHPW
jgi:hypothetical protein